MKKENRVTNIVIVAFFVAALFLPTIASLLPLQTFQALEEKRNLASLSISPMTLKRLERFPQEFEAYYNDHFTLRSTLIRLYNKFKLMVLDESPQDDVVMGDEGWMFYAGDHILEDIFALEPFSQAELEVRRRIIEGKRDWLAEQGAAYLFVVAPNKHSIYREFMPEDYRRLSGRSRFDQLIEYLKRHSDIELIDLRPPLLSVKDQYDLFYRTDSHWNKFGGFFAYRHIMPEINRLLEHWDAQPYDISDYTITSSMEEGGDLAKVLALEDSFKQEFFNFQPQFESCLATREEPNYLGRKWKNAAPVIYECERAAGKMVVFHDSFIGNIRPFITEHFKKSVFLFLYHHDFDTLKYVVTAERPDLVVEQIQERFLGYMHLEQQFPGPSWEEQFSDSNQTMLKIDPSASIKSFNRPRQMKISSIADGFFMETSHRKARLELPKVKVPSAPRSVIRIDITSPEETILEVEYHSKKENDFRGAQTREIAVEKGRNVVYLGIPNLDFSGRLRLRPGKKPGAYILHHLEIRSAG
jgi:hypothetical protein